MNVRLTKPLWDSPELHTPWDDADILDRREQEEEERLQRFEAREMDGDCNEQQET